jgi:hypothetical protein
MARTQFTGPVVRLALAFPFRRPSSRFNPFSDTHHRPHEVFVNLGPGVDHLCRCRPPRRAPIATGTVSGTRSPWSDYRIKGEPTSAIEQVQEPCCDQQQRLEHAHISVSARIGNGV